MLFPFFRSDVLFNFIGDKYGAHLIIVTHCRKGKYSGELKCQILLRFFLQNTLFALEVIQVSEVHLLVFLAMLTPLQQSLQFCMHVLKGFELLLCAPLHSVDVPHQGRKLMVLVMLNSHCRLVCIDCPNLVSDIFFVELSDSSCLLLPEIVKNLPKSGLSLDLAYFENLAIDYIFQDVSAT